MNEEQLKNAERQYQNWSDSELVRATTAEKQDYQQWALALMEQELFRREIPTLERDRVEKVVLEQVEGERKRLAGIPWLLPLFGIVVLLLGSLINALYLSRGFILVWGGFFIGVRQRKDRRARPGYYSFGYSRHRYNYAHRCAVSCFSGLWLLVCQQGVHCSAARCAISWIFPNYP
jgi:hypothetical protein